MNILNNPSGDNSLLQAGSGISYNSQNGTITNSGVLSLTGTTNRITASASTGNVTLTLPQDIATSSNVSFNQVTLGSTLKFNNGSTDVSSLVMNGGAGTMSHAINGNYTNNLASGVAVDFKNASNSSIFKIQENGTITAGTITAALTGLASQNLPLAGGTMGGTLNMGGYAISNILTHTLQATAAHSLIMNNSNAQNNIYFNNGSKTLEIGQKTSTDSYLYSSSGASYLFYFDSTNNPIAYNNLKPVTNGTQDFGNSAAKWNTIWASVGAINTSDRNAKENIVNCDLGVDFINRLSPKIYKYKDVTTQRLEYDGSYSTITQTRTRNHLGVIAQDVEQVLKDIARPEDTNGIRDFGIFAKDATTGEYGLRYEEFIAPLIKSVQELNARLVIAENKLIAHNIT